MASGLLASAATESTPGSTPIWPQYTTTVLSNGVTTILEVLSSTALPSATPTGSSKSSGSGPYIYTFLITLAILIAVSCAIISRSFTIRRRFRLQMQHAIDNGLSIQAAPGSALAQRIKRFDPKRKPIIYEICLEEGTGEKGWNDMDPVSSNLVRLGEFSNGEVSGNNIPLTRELATEFYGIDMRSTRDVIDEFWATSAENHRRAINTVREGLGFSPRPPRTDSRATSTRGTGQGQAAEVKGDDGVPKNVVAGVVIAMPETSRPQYASQLSEDEKAKDARSNRRASMACKSGDLPYLALGSYETRWDPTIPGRLKKATPTTV